MKRLFLLLFTFAFLHSFAQVALTYDSVLVFEGKPKDKLYSLSKLFVVQAFKDSKEVIQLEDKENGVIIGKGNFSHQFSNPRFNCNRETGKGIVEFTLKIQVKDGKIKVTMTDFNHSPDRVTPYGYSYSIPNKVNLGMIYKDKSYSTDEDEDNGIDKCKADIYKDILSQSFEIYKTMLEKLKVEFSKEIKSEDW